MHFADQAASAGQQRLGAAFTLMVLSVEREVAEAKSRLVHVSLLALNLRFMENWRSVQISTRGSAFDYECTMILMAIIVIGAEKLLRTELDPELQTLARQLPQDRFSRVNFSSIAAATAINRETVRRKVNDLQKAGVVVRDKEGIRIAQNVLDFEVLRDVIDAQLDAVARLVNQLSRLGVLLVSEPPDG